MHGHRDGESIGKFFLSSMKPLGKDLVTICYQKKEKNIFACHSNSSLPIPSRGSEAMTPLVDSEAQFNLRLEQVRVPPTSQDCTEELRDHHNLLVGICTWPAWPDDSC